MEDSILLFISNTDFLFVRKRFRLEQCFRRNILGGCCTHDSVLLILLDNLYNFSFNLAELTPNTLSIVFGGLLSDDSGGRIGLQMWETSETGSDN